MKKTFSKAYEKASKEFAVELDALVKSKAAEDGWDDNVASSLSVKYKSGSFLGIKYGSANFTLSNKPKYNQQVFDLEYGNGTKLGTGTLHKLKNNPKDLADKFAVIYEKWVMKL